MLSRGLSVFVMLAASAPAALAAVAVQTGAVDVAALFRPADHDAMSISPDGVHLAATVELADRKVLVILDRASMKIRARVDPGKDGGIEGYRWLGSGRLIADASRRFGQNAGRSTLPFWYAVDVDGKRPQRFYGSIVGLIPGDERHVLLGSCASIKRGKCLNEVLRFDTVRGSKVDTVAKAPLPNASFMADRKGIVRLAWGWDDDDRQQVFARSANDAEWRLVHDEDAAHVEMYPVGVSADLASAVVQVEQIEGPDSIEKLDLAAGTRQSLMRHPRVDPSSFLWSAGDLEPIGGVFDDGKPKSGFWISGKDAETIRGLENFFEGESVRVTSRSADGRWAVVFVQSDREPGRFHLFDGDSGEMRLLTRLRPAVAISAMRPTEFGTVSARDGIAIPVLVTRPQGQAPFPTVVVIHGGPHGIRNTWGFDSEVQALAAQGFAVVQPDFRGSGGYGRAFEESGYRQWGRAMQRDIADSARWAIEQGIAQPDRICAYGTSYGAYSALMGVATDPSLFRCAAGLAGPYDLRLLFEWGDTHRSKWGRKYLERVVGTSRQQLAASSPVTLAKSIRAPVLLGYGGRDGRVSPQHALAMEQALREAGNPPVMYRRDFEGHGLADTSNHLQFVRELLIFMRQHLVAAP